MGKRGVNWPTLTFTQNGDQRQHKEHPLAALGTCVDVCEYEVSREYDDETSSMELH